MATCSIVDNANYNYTLFTSTMIALVGTTEELLNHTNVSISEAPVQHFAAAD